MAHEREAIIAEIRSRISGLSSPAPLVYEQNQTDPRANSLQLAFDDDEPNYAESTRTKVQIRMRWLCTIRALTEEYRDDTSALLHAAILAPGANITGTLETLLDSTDIGQEEQGGQRIYPATYSFVTTYYRAR